MSNSKGFVVKSIKNGETSMIVSCYLEDIGLESFIVKGVYGTKKNKFTKAHFFPLNFISIDYSVSKTGRLGYIKEVKPLKLYTSLHSNVEKSTVIIFLSEILNSIFKEEGEENPLEHSLEEMASQIWAKMEQKDWDFPIPVGWKPKDEKWRLWNE